MSISKNIKKVEYYGVEMTPIEGFKFTKFLSDPINPAMNTLTREERFTFANDWLTTLQSNELTEKKLNILLI